MTDPTHKHHSEFPLKELRDHIATVLRNTYVSMGVAIGNEGNARETYRKHLEARLTRAQEELFGFEQGCAYAALLDQYGWKERDCSDHVHYDTDTYRSFIGTKEEFEQIYGKQEG